MPKASRFSHQENIRPHNCKHSGYLDMLWSVISINQYKRWVTKSPWGLATTLYQVKLRNKILSYVHRKSPSMILHLNIFALIPDLHCHLKHYISAHTVIFPLLTPYDLVSTSHATKCVLEQVPNALLQCSTKQECVTKYSHTKIVNHHPRYYISTYSHSSPIPIATL